jgi:hypothetical protein
VNPGGGEDATSESTSFEELLASLLGAMSGAKGSLDATSVELAKAYWSDPILRNLPPPYFTVPEMRIHLRFAVADVAPAKSTRSTRGSVRRPQLRITVAAASLEKLPPHLISEMELRVTPQTLRIFETEQEPIESRRGEMP